MKKRDHSSLSVGLIIAINALLFLFLGKYLSAQVKHRFDIRIPMRDGIKLSADIWMPSEEGRYPAILIRTPYLKTSESINAPETGIFFASRGYVFIVQDCRGRGDSEDEEFNFYFADPKDGYDTIEWIAQQPWCNGKVGMMGVSYMGAVQWLAAREHPPHLVCIAPTAASGRYFDELPYLGGAWMIRWALEWLNITSGRISQTNTSSINWDALLKHRPLLDMDEAMGRKMRLYKEWLVHNTIDDYWKRIIFTAEDFRKMDLPALHVTGWFDSDQPGALSYWDGMSKYSPAEDKQYLVIGPWNHIQTYQGGALKIGEIELAGDSVVDRRIHHLTFFDHYLKGSSPEFDHPKVKVYLTGLNKWLELSKYPPSKVEYRPLYLRSGGRANTSAGDGSLSWTPPQKEPPDRYAFNPQNPAPGAFAYEFNAFDNRAIERRDDVLVYTSEVLNESLTILGPVFTTLYASSDALDTDFTAKCLDVYPDGRAVNLGPVIVGIKRARYRKGYEKEELLTPGKPEKFRIELFDIGHTFLQRHRLRIEISSSAYPAFNPNQNTGNPVATDTEWKIASQTIYHDSSRPSHILLPVMPEK